MFEHISISAIYKVCLKIFLFLILLSGFILFIQFLCFADSTDDYIFSYDGNEVYCDYIDFGNGTLLTSDSDYITLVIDSSTKKYIRKFDIKNYSVETVKVKEVNFKNFLDYLEGQYND